MIPQTLSEHSCLLGRYVLEKPLARGGSSILYLAKDQDKAVVIKECFVPQWMTRDETGAVSLLPDYYQEAARALAAFRQEAELLYRCQDVPGLVKRLDSFSANGTVYLVLEYIPGGTLRTVLEERKVTLTRRLAWLATLGNILEAMHRAGVLQLDINPENVLITPDGTVRLLDLGGGCLLGQRPVLVQAQETYAAPELYTGEALTEHTDVYGFCALAYEVLTGRPSALARSRILEDDLLPPRDLAPELPQDISDALMQGLSLKAQDRASLAEILQRGFHQESTGERNGVRDGKAEIQRDVGSAPPAQKKVRAAFGGKRWMWLAAAAAVIAVAVWYGVSKLPNQGQTTLQAPDVPSTVPAQDPTESMDTPPQTDETPATETASTLPQTETFSIQVDYRMDEDDVEAMTETLETRLEEFAGGNYQLRQEEGYWIATVPLATFGDRSVHQVLQEQFSLEWEGHTLRTFYRPRVEWTAGTLSQDEEQIWLLYSAYSEYSSIQWNGIFMELEGQLEALQIPYRLGHQENNDCAPVIAISPADYDEEIFQVLAGGIAFLYATGREGEEPMHLSDLTSGEVSVEEVAGEQVLRLQIESDYDREKLEALSQEALEEPAQQICLGLYNLYSPSPRFTGDVESVITDGCLTLTMCPGELPGLGDFVQYAATEREVYYSLSQDEVLYLPSGYLTGDDLNPAQYYDYDHDIAMQQGDAIYAAGKKLEQLGISAARVRTSDEDSGILYIYLNYSRTDDWIVRSAELLRELAQLPEIRAVECPIDCLVLAQSEMGTDQNLSVILLQYRGERYISPTIRGDALEQDLAEIERVWSGLEVPGYTVYPMF